MELTSKPVYLLGEKLSYSLKTNRICYLYMFELGAEGEVTLLLPNKHQDYSQSPLHPGISLTVPDPAFPNYFFLARSTGGKRRYHCDCL